MKRSLCAAVVVLALTPGVAPAQMAGGMGGGPMGGKMGGGMGGGNSAMGAGDSAMGAGAMGQGMMSGMMAQCREMMAGAGGGGAKPGGAAGHEPMGSMMPSMMDGMMPGKARGCMMMAEGMMKGQMDLGRMRKTLALSDEQSEKLRAGVRPFQREAILVGASLKVAELELGDLLAGEKVDFGKVEAKLKEVEAMRTKVRLAHLKAADAVKGVLGKEQLDKLEKAVESAPAGDGGHEQHH